MSAARAMATEELQEELRRARALLGAAQTLTDRHRLAHLVTLLQLELDRRARLLEDDAHDSR